MHREFECSGDYKRFAKERLRGKWPLSILVFFVAGFLDGGFGGGSRLEIDEDTLHSLETLFPGFLDLIRSFLPILTAIFVPIVLLGILCLFIGGAVEMGLCLYSLDLVDGREPAFSRLFARFDIFINAFCLRLLTALAVVVGTLLLIVPGILLSYGLRLAPFILAEEPETGVVEAMKRSWNLMNGYKMELFILDLSFLGWALLSVLTLGLLSLWLMPYQGVTVATFYRVIRTTEEGPPESYL